MAYRKNKAWARRQVAAGNCARCGQPRTHFASRCDACHLAHGGRPHGTHRKHLDEDTVLAIRERYAAGGISMRKLAAEVGTTATNLSLVLYGMTWRHVGGPLAAPPETRPRRGRPPMFSAADCARLRAALRTTCTAVQQKAAAVDEAFAAVDAAEAGGRVADS